MAFVCVCDVGGFITITVYNDVRVGFEYIRWCRWFIRLCAQALMVEVNSYILLLLLGNLCPLRVP